MVAEIGKGLGRKGLAIVALVANPENHPRLVREPRGAEVRWLAWKDFIASRMAVLAGMDFFTA